MSALANQIAEYVNFNQSDWIVRLVIQIFPRLGMSALANQIAEYVNFNQSDCQD